MELGGFSKPTGAKAAGTDFHPNRLSLFRGLHFVKIGVLDFLSLVIGVANIVSKGRPFSADITHFRHSSPSI
jgi:hypothetical protein